MPRFVALFAFSTALGIVLAPPDLSAFSAKIAFRSTAPGSDNLFSSVKFALLFVDFDHCQFVLLSQIAHALAYRLLKRPAQVFVRWPSDRSQRVNDLRSVF
jgi:hypothetical protein